MTKPPLVETPEGWVPSGLKVRGKASGKQTRASTSAQPVMAPAPPAEPVPEPVPEPAPEADAPKAAVESKVSFRPMPVLTVLSIICLGILYMLGDWQWTKYVEKSRAPALSAATAPVSVAAALQSSQPEYRPVELTGLVDPRSVNVRALRDGISGYRIFTPVVLEDGWIFVDRGFVAEADANKVPVLSGQISYRGVLRKGAKANSFTPDNDPILKDWYWPDLPAMGASLKLTGGSPAYYVALNLVDPLATGQTQINPWADSKGANQIPPERHLGYALTWWGFGFALIGVYTGLHIRTGRLRFGRSPS
jgi:surfeit locus 1 family protein